MGGFSNKKNFWSPQNASLKVMKDKYEDVLVKVDKYIFPVDFVVLDVDKDVDVPLILARLFLHTSKALINMDGGKMTLRIGNENLTYRFAKAMRHFLDFNDTLYFINVIDDLVDDYMQEFLHPELFEGWSNQEIEEKDPPVDKELEE